MIVILATFPMMSNPWFNEACQWATLASLPWQTNGKTPLSDRHRKGWYFLPDIPAASCFCRTLTPTDLQQNPTVLEINYKNFLQKMHLHSQPQSPTIQHDSTNPPYRKPIRNGLKEANRAAEVIAEEAEELVEEAKELAETVVEAATCCSIHTSIHLFVATILFTNWLCTIGLDIINCKHLWTVSKLWSFPVMLTTLLQEVQHASSSGLHILKDFMEAKVVDTVRLLLRLLPPVTLA